jgi:hypothetical protein
MTARRYALGLVAVAMIMFAGTIAANLIIDPQGVFGSPVFPVHLNPNVRYHLYRTYNAQASQVEGLIFGSSRANQLDDELLRKFLPQQGRFIDLTMPFGGMTDDLPMLEYILRDKAQRGEAISNIVLVLDLDFLGKQPWTNINIAAFLPPALGTESAGRFWWRYLTAVEIKSWIDTIRASMRFARDVRPAASLATPRISRASMIAAPPLLASPQMLINDFKDAGAPAAARLGEIAGVVINARDRRQSNSVRPDLEHQVLLFARFVALCRDHNIHLLVMTSPILRYYLDSFLPGDLQHNLDLVARFAPIWDFTTQGDIADRTDLWIDDSHFRRPVVEMMLGRAFGDASLAKFGRLVPQASP